MANKAPKTIVQEEQEAVDLRIQLAEDGMATLRSRFMARVEKGAPLPVGPCWIWRGHDGYVHRIFPTPKGIERLRGRFWMCGKQVPAYVAAWVIFNGPLGPTDKVKRDRLVCQSYRCVNPKHLQLGFRLPGVEEDMKFVRTELTRGPGRPRLPENAPETSYDGVARDGLPPLLPEETPEDLRHERIAERSRLVAARRRGEGS
jgi:hypothetical protein